MRKVLLILSCFPVLLLFAYLKNHYSNKTIVRSIIKDANQYRQGLDRLIDTCEALVTNNPTKFFLNYRNGWDSIMIVYTDGSASHKQTSGKISTRVVSFDMTLGSKTFFISYKKNDFLSIYYGMPNYTFQHSWLEYCYNQNSFLKNHHLGLKRYYTIDEIHENSFVYIIDTNWIIVVRDV